MKSAIALALLLCASGSFASRLSDTHRDWPKSPQGYFMTNAERARWSAIQTDAEAEQFVNDFVAQRGGAAFTDEVAHRVAMADKYLTIGGLPGSKTLRGKIVVVLGPPASMEVTRPYRIRARTSQSAAPEGYGGGSAAESGGSETGSSMSDASSAASSAEMSGSSAIDYSFTYPSATKSAKPLVLTVWVDAQSGSDRLKDSRQSRDLAEALEAAAEAQRVSASSALKTP